MKSVAVIIVNYNVTNELINCLNSINTVFAHLELEIIVVDNNSSDKFLVNNSSKFPNVRFIFLDENLGYSKANSIGSLNSSAEYLLFLNPDTEIIEDFITPIIQFIESNSKVGACGPMLLFKDKKYQNSFGETFGLFHETAEALMFINFYREIIKYFPRKKFISQKPFEVGWISGACLLVKRSVFNEVGGFDPKYFLNYEDIDLCGRFHSFGYKNYYFPYIKCIHFAQKSQKQDYEKLTYCRYISRLIYAKKHYGFIKRFLVRFIHLIGLLLRMLFVNFLYSNSERKQRRRGYVKSLFLYLGFVE